MKRIALAAALLVSLAAPAWAGLDAGWAAYERGDYLAALREWRPLADRGHAAAQNNLGVMYAAGQGVKQDFAAAATWHRRAAEQGHALAQSQLGVIYGNGRGVPQDYVQAHLWFTLSAAQGNDDTARKNRELVAEKMTPAQIAEAQKLAREWKPKKE
ncbi:MAG: sel1 repeat family protein [Proteobacteria bacterium]|nr:sel1 repeat family protein [Pseudomonadota bacterium]